MTREEAVSIIEDRVRVTEYVRSSYVDCVDIEALKMAIEALKGKDTNVPGRKGVFIPDITVEMFRNASLEGVEGLMESGEMEDISLPSAQPEKDVLAWLLAYHMKSFDLNGRYMAHEVIGWLVHDFAIAYMAERREDE